MTIGPTAVVPAPPLSPPPTGLLQSAQVVDFNVDGNAVDDQGNPTGDPIRWIVGLTFVAEPCGDGEVEQLFCAGGAESFDTGNTRTTSPAYEPFVVAARDECSTFGWQLNDYQGRAQRKLRVVEGMDLEHEFWTGAEIAANPHLADNSAATKLNSGTAYNLHAGLAALSRAIADARIGLGYIHASADLVELWLGNGYIYRDGGKLYTANGNLVISGNGYPGTAPDGTAATVTSTWAYATDPVLVYRGAVEVFPKNLPDATDKAANTVAFRAERPFAVLWNQCLHVAAHIDPTLNPGAP